MVKYLILGGGVAGLSAAIALAQHGEQPLVLEGGGYPSHKVCGEFLSPAALPFLASCSIHPILVKNALLHTNAHSLSLPFPEPAGSLSHYELDAALAAYAQSLGAEVRTAAKIKCISGKYQVRLESGEIIEAENLLLAAGRLPLGAPPSSPRYMGLKAHFSGIHLGHTLEMFSFPGAYLGLTPIENKKCNLACLARIGSMKSNPQAFIEELAQKNSRLKFLLDQGILCFAEWMQAPIPAFGIKKTPLWENAYFIGDAAATIPPASGNGLTLALLGGLMAANYALKRDYQGFRKDWRKRFAKHYRMGKILHTIMLNPLFGNTFFQMQRLLPSMTSFVSSKNSL